MTTQTIRIGIDLGTTNSAVAVRKDNEMQVVRNNWNDELTPSVFGINRGGQKEVGRRAYEKLYRDPTEEHVENYVAEVKRVMGEDEQVEFSQTEEKYNPEEISAEILKSLRKDVLRKYPDLPADGVVITVPAHFSTLHSEATRRAGQMAGFEHVVLLQEPIAAAMKYGLDGEEDGNWLVYDLGGGTFDTALISSHGGSLTVREHFGDRHLGGKDFDQRIVDELIRPKIDGALSSGQNTLSEVARHKLRYHAEECKKILSRKENVKEHITGLDGEFDSFQLEISRDEFIETIQRDLDRTIDLCEKTISNSGIEPSAIDRIILVGGSTRIPRVREQLDQAFPAPVDTSMNPTTVVAEGACVYAAGQEIPDEKQTVEHEDQSAYTVELNFDSLTSQQEEPISGRIESLPDDQKFSLNIHSDSGHFNKSNIEVNDGTFYVDVFLEENRENTFNLELVDGKGEIVKIEPDSFSIQHGPTVSGAPLPHSIGVSVLDKISGEEEMEFYFEKNEQLPLEDQKTFQTSRTLRQNETGNTLPLRVYEGESTRPDRNTFICEVELTGEGLPYDLPEGSEVELSIEVDESRELKLQAYLPEIDQWFNARGTVYDREINQEDLKKELKQIRNDRSDIIQYGSREEQEKIQYMMEEVEELTSGQRVTDDDRRKARERLKEVQRNLDDIEEESVQDRQKNQFESLCNEIDEILTEAKQEIDTDQKEEKYQELKTKGEEAIENEDIDGLKRVNDQLDQFLAQLLSDIPSTWYHMFEELKSGKYRFQNRDEANRYIRKGEMAIDQQNIEQLTYCVQELLSLVSDEEEKRVRSQAGIKR